MKRVCTLLTALVLIILGIALLHPEAKAIVSSYGENLTWIYDSNTRTLTISGTGDMKNYYFGGSPFRDYGYVDHIVIEEGVTSIGEYAFACTNKYESPLSITIPTTMKRIESDAFFGCVELADVYITDPSAWCKIDFITNPLVYGGQLHILSKNGKEMKEIVLDKSVTEIGSYVFANCQLSSITIPQSVTSLSSYAFRNATIKSIVFTGSAPTIDDGAFYNANATIYTFLPWDANILKPYFGYLTWHSGAESVEYSITDKARRFYKVNEPLELPEIIGTAVFENQSISFTITGDVTTENVNNKTGGLKSVELRIGDTVLSYDYYVGYVGNEGEVNAAISKCIPIGNNGLTTISVSCMGFSLLEGVDYTVEYKNNTVMGNDAEVIITGLGVFDGWSTSSKFSILKADISGASVSAADATYNGNPQTPTPVVTFNGTSLIKDRDYIVKYINNVKKGTATVQVIGIGNYTGVAKGTFKICCASDKTIAFTASNNAVTLRDQGLTVTFGSQYFCGYDLYWNGNLISNCSIAPYEINSIPSDITVSSSEFSQGAGTYKLKVYKQGWSSKLVNVAGSYTYRPYATGSKTWKTFTITVHDTYVPSTPSKLTALEPQIIDFRTLYLGVEAESNDNLFPQTWSTSNSAVATVKNGIVTLHKAGKATITVKVGSLEATWTINAEALNVQSGMTMYYNASTKTVQLVYENELLTQGKDYTVTKQTSAGIVKVTIQGCGLFDGTALRIFDANTGELLSVPGDIDGDESVTQDDAVYLLLHTMFGEAFYPLNNAPADIDGSGVVDQDDAVYLLLHTMFGESFYPLNTPALPVKIEE